MGRLTRLVALAIAGAIVYWQRAAIGVALVTIGGRLIPDMEMPEEDVKRVERALIAGYCELNGRTYPRWLP